MKKNRPGILLSILCLPADSDRLAALMMKHTTTLGIRRQDMSRYVLNRESVALETPLGQVRIKKATGMGVERCKAEFDDLAAIAEEKGMSLASVREMIR